MTCYIVSFQTSDDETRRKLIASLKTYKKYCPINHTCWAVVAEQKASEIRDFLKVTLEDGDKLFVVRSGTEAAWRNAFGPKNSEWLKKNL